MKPLVSCLETQAGLFETRLLRRVATPTFISSPGLPDKLNSPLLLYGEWQQEGFWQGLSWLSTIIFTLPYPSVLFPPFGTGNLDSVLGLSTQLIVREANLTQLLTSNEGFKFGLKKKSLHIQTDFIFEGQAGNHLVKTEAGTSAVVMLQPKNTSTPLLLCGSRLLSASGLSDDEDRQILTHAILDWAVTWRLTEIESDKRTKPKSALDESKWNTICTIMAGAGSTQPNEIRSLAGSILGIELSKEDIRQAFEQVVQLGLAEATPMGLSLHPDRFEVYTQEHSLWAYVRALRKDFGKGFAI